MGRPRDPNIPSRRQHCHIHGMTEFRLHNNGKEGSFRCVQCHNERTLEWHRLNDPTHRKPATTTGATMGTGYYTLTRQDLAGFAPRATEMVLRAMDLGATGRISSKGHAILRAPSGATMSISKLNTGNRKAIANTEASWVRTFGALDSADKAAQVAQVATTPPEALQAATPADVLAEPTLECPLPDCEAVFATQGAYYSHTATKHARCPEGCGHVTVDEQSMAEHVEQAHTEQPVTQNDVREDLGFEPMRYECKPCGRTFRRKSDLSTHNRTAHRVADLKCPDCDEVFANAQGLSAHTRFNHRAVPPLALYVANPNDPQAVIDAMRTLLGTDADTTEVEALRQQVADLTKRAEAAEARVAALKEFLS